MHGGSAGVPSQPLGVPELPRLQFSILGGSGDEFGVIFIDDSAKNN
jgi:hypothetical protein